MNASGTNDDRPTTHDPVLSSFGVNALTGGYLISHVDAHRIATIAADEEQRRQMRGEIIPVRTAPERDRGWGTPDWHNLAEMRWGVIFAEDEDPAVRRAVQRLIDHRRSSAIFTYQTGEGVDAWIVRNGGEPGSGDPERIPYYLCIVGEPEKIPFAFQYGLDTEYGVGRICFDQATDYEQYIENVIAYEEPRNRPANCRQAVLMGATHPGDDATTLSSEYLVPRLADRLAAFSPVLYLGSGLTVGHQALQGEMTKDTLRTLLMRGNDQLPVLLLTASHGWAYPAPDNRQRPQQGALVCQGWDPGQVTPDPTWLFAARDVPVGADLRGLVVFAFACFSAGTPRFSYYARLQANSLEAADVPITSGPFVAALPKKLLSRPNGPLGFFGHIEQTWPSSFYTTVNGKPQSTIIAFERAAKAILNGYPLGHALQDFNDRNGRFTQEVSNLLEQKLRNQPVDERDFATKWLQRNDARGFILLGDPGVAVRVYDLPGV